MSTPPGDTFGAGSQVKYPWASGSQAGQASIPARQLGLTAAIALVVGGALRSTSLWPTIGLSRETG